MMKYVLILKMPSGSLFAVSVHENNLVLMPMEKGKTNFLRQVMAFDSFDEAERWRTETSNLSEQGKKLMDMVNVMSASELQ